MEENLKNEGWKLPAEELPVGPYPVLATIVYPDGKREAKILAWTYSAFFPKGHWETLPKKADVAAWRYLPKLYRG